MLSLGKILTSDQVAKALGWPGRAGTQRARRWLMRTGAGTKRGGRVITSYLKLVAHFPEAAAEVSASGLCDAE